jgi:hypothetical protein
LLTWRRIEEVAATKIRAKPAVIAAVFSEPADDEPAAPELIALSAT